MNRSRKLVVFTDLDGTLLDHESYSWDAARPAVDALKQHDIPLVPVTSKTRAELKSLRNELNNHHPYVVENGAAIYIPDRYFSGMDGSADDSGEHLVSTGPRRQALQAVLTSARMDSGFGFKSFTELGADGIASLTGLSHEDADRANQRAASEPLLWEDTESRLEEFADSLHQQQLRCVRGGRFVHVMGQFDKADAVARLVGLYARKYGGIEPLTVALGDGPNDLRMLAGADIAVVIKGQHPYDMPLDTSSRVVRTTLTGPAGWNTAVLDILDDTLLSTHTGHTPD